MKDEDKKKKQLINELEVSETQLMQMEETLKEDEERLKTILNRVQVGIVVIDEETHEIVDVNPMAAKIIGLPKEEIVGRICHKFICSAEMEKCPITDLGEKIDNSERVLINANGEEVPILKTVVPVMLKNRRYIIDSFIDISERKRAEEKLRASEEQFRTIVETAPSLLTIADAKGNNIYISPNCEEITGYTQEELQGGVRWWVHEDDIPRAKEIFDRTFREGVGGQELRI